MRRAFSLLECTVSVMLVGILMAATLRTLSTSQLRDGNSLLRMQAKQLCESLLQEIASKSFAEPGAAAAQFGLDATELQTLRTTLDDVDDYANMNVAPPTDARGNLLAGFDQWKVMVLVTWADASTLSATAATNTNLKRFEIRAYHANQLIATVTGYRAADDY